jgi:hypothetical protein
VISREAHTALARLEHGERLNVMHTIARELIAAGLARDNFGSLELTEAGRRVGRREYRVTDEHIHDLGDRWSTPADSHPDATASWPPIDRSPNPWWKNRTAEEPVVIPAENSRAVAPITRAELDEDLKLRPMVPEPLPPAAGPLAWSRARAACAAGIANGKTDIWVDDAWVQAFMDAYEG